MHLQLWIFGPKDNSLELTYSNYIGTVIDLSRLVENLVLHWSVALHPYIIGKKGNKNNKNKGNSTFYPVVCNFPQHATLDLLGLTFQYDCKFFAHIKAKLCKPTNVYTCWEHVERSTTAR